MKKKKEKIYLLGLIVIIIVAILCGAMIYDSCTVDAIELEYQSFSEFSDALSSDAIYVVYTDRDAQKAQFIYKSDLSEDIDSTKDPKEYSLFDLRDEKWYYTNYISCEAFDEQLLSSGTPVIANGFSSKFSSTLEVLINLVPTLLMLYVLLLVLESVGQQFNRGENKHVVVKNSSVRFSDVIGHDEVIEDIKQYITILKNSKAMSDNHVQPPKGILFTGAPGTGKTLLAKAMAGEANVPFIYLNTSNVIEIFVGQGSKSIRSCFKQARELAPCIVFLDEIDAIGCKRDGTRGTSEDNQTLLALLQELDGFQPKDGVLVIAATNTPERLDPAIKRTGRFDREIRITPPRNKDIRVEMLEHYTSYYTLSPDVSLKGIASQLSGMTGADISVICNEAAMLATLRSPSKPVVTNEDFEIAIDKLLLKGSKSKDKSKLNKDDHEIVAYHESGHALMCYLLEHPISRITIQGSTSGVGGFVLPEDEDSQFRTKQYLQDQVQIAYAGRLAEELIFGQANITTGAQNDIQMATQYMMQYMLSFGFSKVLGLLDYQTLGQSNLVDKTMVLNNMVSLANEWKSAAAKLLADNKDKLELLAKTLLERETMTGSEVEELLATGK